jgi:hypothetical protein
MSAHKSNPLLRWGILPICIVSVGLLAWLYLTVHSSHATSQVIKKPLMGSSHSVVNTASQDSAAESLDTLTVQWSATEQRVKSIVEANHQLQQDNKALLQQLQEKTDRNATALTTAVTQLQSQMDALTAHSTTHHEKSDTPQPIQTVPELAETLHISSTDIQNFNGNDAHHTTVLPKPVYTIPANATAVQNRLMTALVGRIPVKGVVTDPYPFKIVFADDTLAANGLRVPNLRQMIVSGYTEGDLNLVSVRGWVTSLTFVFNDGTISTTTSNDNNIGRYTKENALGYLSDATGNPFIHGKLITNAPAYVGINVALGATQGAANAFAQSQTTSNVGSTGNTTSSVTGSVGAFVAGQSGSAAMNQVQQWWHDREENSFDAVYVPTVDLKTQKPQTVVVNFAKEIHIDYDQNGRKIVYVEKSNRDSIATLD